ncbi:MAG: 2-phospho-L-lactate guanylyltransferase [Sphingomonadales bacterium]
MHAVVPVKATAAAKRRLSPVLNAAERTSLAAAMARDVLASLAGQPGLEGVWLCAPVDPSAKALAQAAGVGLLAEVDGGGLNAAIGQAARQLASQGAEDILIVHGDLPLLGPVEIAAFIAAHRQHAPAPQVTLCADRHGIGTNLLAWRPLSNFTPAFGPDSFARHQALARAAAAQVQICNIPVGRFDIDEPADLMALLNQDHGDRGRHSLAYLRGQGIARRLAAALPISPGEGNGESC